MNYLLFSFLVISACFAKNDLHQLARAEANKFSREQRQFIKENKAKREYLVSKAEKIKRKAIEEAKDNFKEKVRVVSKKYKKEAPNQYEQMNMFMALGGGNAEKMMKLADDRIKESWSLYQDILPLKEELLAKELELNKMFFEKKKEIYFSYYKKLNDFYNNYDYSRLQSADIMNLKYNAGVNKKCEVLKDAQQTVTNVNIFTNEFEAKNSADLAHKNAQSTRYFYQWKSKQLRSFAKSEEGAAVLAQIAQNIKNEANGKKATKPQAIKPRELPAEVKAIHDKAKDELDKLKIADQQNEDILDKQGRKMASISEDHQDYIRYMESQFSCDKSTVYKKVAWQPMKPE